MPISFSTTKLTSDRKKMHTPNGAESVGQLLGFNGIKLVDLKVGTSLGADSSVDRTWVDPDTLTYLHGQDGILAKLKFRKNKEG